MKYIIGSNVEEIVARSSGKPFKKFNVKDEHGVIFNDVVAFPFFSNYGLIVANATVEGVVREEEYNGRKSVKMVDGTLGPKPASMGGFGVKNMEVKAQGIAKAQERKEDGIMISSTARMATEAAIATMEGGTTPLSAEEFKVSWLGWRKWFVENWENVNGPLKISGTDINYPTDDIKPEDIPF